MALNKSQAEAVNFGNAVATKAYEKKAGLVDTFVRTETAEQKLAKSGKMQTAQALEALASLGGTALKGKAMQMEQKAQRQQAALATTTAQAIEDLQEGRIQNLAESEDYADLPVYLQVQLAQDVGKQEATKAFQQIQLDYDAAGTLHTNDADYNALRNGQFTSPDAEDGVSLHRQMSRNNALESFLGRLDVQNNKYKSAENLDRLGRAFGNSINDVVLAGKGSNLSGVDIWQNLVEYDRQMGGISGLTNGQRKKLMSERVMALAISTDDLTLLNPANIPDLFQDPATLNKFADTKQMLEKKVKSDLAASLSLQTAERTARNNQVIDDAVEGVLEKKAQADGFESLDNYQKEALINQRNKDTVSMKKSQATVSVTRDLVRNAFEAEEPFLTDRLGTVIVNPITNKEVEMTTESLTSYLSVTPDINPTDAKLLMKELEGLSQQTGFNNSFKPVEQTVRKIVGEQLKNKTVYAEGGQEELIDLVEDFYREGYSAIIDSTNKKPTPRELRSLALKAKMEARRLIPEVLFDGTIPEKGSGGASGVSLDGELIEGAVAGENDDASTTTTVPAAATKQFNLISQLADGEQKDAYLKRLNEQYGTSLTFGDTPEETPVVEAAVVDAPVVEATPLDDFEMSELWNHLNKKRQGTNSAERPAYISKADLKALTPEELQDVFGQDLLEIQAEKDESQAVVEGGQNFAADTLDFIKEYTPFIDNEREALEREEDELIESIYDENLSAKERVQYKKTLKLPERFYRLNEETNAQEVYIPE